MKLLTLIVALLWIVIPDFSSAPVFTAETQFAYFIQGRHKAMSQWLEAVGMKAPKYLLPLERAKLYARILMREAKERGREAELWGLVVPYIDQGSGFINGINDKHLKHPSIGLYEVRKPTGDFMGYHMEKYSDIPSWSRAKWKDKNLLDLDFANEFGWDLIEKYLDDYDGDYDRVFHALVAGPEGERHGHKIEFKHFHNRQKRAKTHLKFLKKHG